MRGKTGDPQLDGALVKLAGALRGLDGTDARPIARRNARRRVLGALAGLRGQVDQRWPAIVKRAGVRRLKTYAARAARLTRAGWEKVTSVGALAAYAAAGVPVRRVSGPAALRGEGEAPPATVSGDFVPSWAVAIGPGDQARLRATRRSTQAKQAARAEAALRIELGTTRRRIRAPRGLASSAGTPGKNAESNELKN
jgi:hypothetical protein